MAFPTYVKNEEANTMTKLPTNAKAQPLCHHKCGLTETWVRRGAWNKKKDTLSNWSWLKNNAIMMGRQDTMQAVECHWRSHRLWLEHLHQAHGLWEAVACTFQWWMQWCCRTLKAAQTGDLSCIFPIQPSLFCQQHPPPQHISIPSNVTNSWEEKQKLQKKKKEERKQLPNENSTQLLSNCCLRVL